MKKENVSNSVEIDIISRKLDLISQEIEIISR